MNQKIISIENLKYFNDIIQQQIQVMINNTINDVISGGSINLVTVESIYPVGSIYISANNVDPSQIFNFGEWERIKDTFLLAAGDEYTAGSTGGESMHTLTIDEMPSHQHQFNRHQLWRDETSNNMSDLENGYGANNKTLPIYADTTSIVGSSQPHNNMPPYLTVYMWKRIK